MYLGIQIKPTNLLHDICNPLIVICFFADAAILVEGAAENMLLPHFMRSKYPKLYQRYITILGVNGRHAHRLSPLIEKLVPTVILEVRG